MKCWYCSTDNPEGTHFCLSCGQPQMRACPNCGNDNPITARFCRMCGTPLVSATPQETRPLTAFDPPNPDEQRLLRLAAAVPAHLAEKMRAAAPRAGERHTVTVLYAGLVDTAAPSGQIAPQDWEEAVDRAFELLAPIIYHHEGTLARLSGDALLAFFGAPVAHDNDPLRAVQAAIGLLEAARSYAQEVQQLYGAPFAIRVGLNTGQVVVGEVNGDLTYEYTAMGDAVNLATRLQTAAAPLTALVTENTYHFVASLVETLDLGLITLKGQPEPLQAYEVRGFKASPGWMRGLDRLESPLVERRAELEALQQLNQAVKAGQGRAALVTGEAGMGKSRLISEWRAAAVPGIHWVDGHCRPYGQRLAYHLLIDLLLSLIGAAGIAGEAEKRAALTRFCEDLEGEERDEVYTFLGYLLSIQLPAGALEQVRALEPQAIQARYLFALQKVLQTLAARQPLVVVLEDLHWADPSSIELLIRLLPILSTTPILLCCIIRPDNQAPGWKLATALRSQLGLGLADIDLHALSPAGARRLAANLLDLAELPETLDDLILGKAGGNPFFVEEIIRMFIDRGLITRQAGRWTLNGEVAGIEIPADLQELLLARIDRLPEDVKRTLRVAAVIGRQFTTQVLEQALAGEGEE
ncbi:MAG: AAA family ATPase [Chloroflexi bacterium]|nr:AAA family ATPase [Chloroflexota bacterium]